MLMKNAWIAYFMSMKYVIHAFFTVTIVDILASFYLRIPLASLPQKGYNKGYALSNFL
jgi:hypothetical protein